MNKTKEITKTAMLISIAVLLGYVESLFPPLVPVAGVKIGLANIVIITELYSGHIKRSWTVSISKVVLCALLFGSATSFVYSLSGAVVSLIIMLAAKKSGAFSLLGVSSLGGVFHNAAQLVCAYFFIGKGALLYIPVLCLTGAISGLVTGLIANLLMKKGRGIFDKE